MRTRDHPYTKQVRWLLQRDVYCSTYGSSHIRAKRNSYINTNLYFLSEIE